MRGKACPYSIILYSVYLHGMGGGKGAAIETMTMANLGIIG
jgi:hypothetical protein